MLTLRGSAIKCEGQANSNYGYLESLVLEIRGVGRSLQELLGHS